MTKQEGERKAKATEPSPRLTAIELLKSRRDDGEYLSTDLEKEYWMTINRAIAILEAADTPTAIDALERLRLRITSRIFNMVGYKTYPIDIVNEEFDSIKASALKGEKGQK